MKIFNSGAGQQNTRRQNALIYIMYTREKLFKKVKKGLDK